MDVDTSAAGSSRSPTSEQPLSALQDVAANLANVKSAIKTGAADRNQVIDMLTNLLRETLQVRPPSPCSSTCLCQTSMHCRASTISGTCLRTLHLSACCPCSLQQWVLCWCRTPLQLPAMT